MATVWVCGISGSGVRSLIDALSTSLPAVRGDADADAAIAMHSIAVRSTEVPAELPDICLLVASAEQGFSAELSEAWHRCAEEFIPRICVWTHIDSGRADDDELRAMAERVLDEDVFPLALPIAGDDEEFIAVLDLPRQEIHLGSQPPLTADAEHIALSSPARDELVDAAAATIDDDNLMNQLNLGLTLNGQRAWETVVSAVRTGQLAVAIPTRPLTPLIGIGLLRTLLSDLNLGQD